MTKSKRKKNTDPDDIFEFDRKIIHRYFSNEDKAMKEIRTFSQKRKQTMYLTITRYGRNFDQTEYCIRHQNEIVNLHENENIIYVSEYIKPVKSEPENQMEILIELPNQTKSINGMTYSEFHIENIGFVFQDTNTGRILTKMEICSMFSASRFILNQLGKDEYPGYVRIDKTGWKDGKLIKKQRESFYEKPIITLK